MKNFVATPGDFDNDDPEFENEVDGYNCPVCGAFNYWEDMDTCGCYADVHYGSD